MSNEEKILELTKRIEVLEKEENKRKTKRKIKIIYEISKIIIFLSIILAGYIYINIKVIKPYKEKVDYVNEKIDVAQSYLEEKINSFKGLFK